MRRGPPADWRPPAKLVVIAASPRTGSSMLGVVVASSGSLGVPHEWLHVDFPWPASVSTLPNATVEECCRLLSAKGVTPNGVAGVRLFGMYFAAIAAEIDFPAWFPDVSWVWLRRRDLVRQAVSFVLAAQTGNWTSSDNRPRHSAYSSEQVRLHLKTLLLHDGIWRGYFRANAIAPLALWYEDIVDRPEDAVRAIAAHAGIELAGQPDRTRLKLRGQADEANDLWVERFRSEPGVADLIAGLDAARGVLPDSAAG